jgi:hypothetical protein
MDEIDNGLPHFEEMLDPAAFSQAWQAGKSMDFETAVLQTRALLQPS